ncbi:MAG: ribosome maturation factor RimP [Elusimicrobiota bacterium]
MNSFEIEEKLLPLFEGSGFEIIDIKIHRARSLVIQIFIDKEQGNVGIDDCEKWSEKIGSFIDINSLIDTPYILEVSSPGIDRLIKKPKDFERFKGRDVKIILKQPIDGTRTYYSKIVDFKDNIVYFEDGLKFNLNDINEVRLNPDDNEIFKKIN